MAEAMKHRVKDCVSRSAKETCECPDPRLFLGKQRQFANLQKSRGS